MINCDNDVIFISPGKKTNVCTWVCVDVWMCVFPHTIDIFSGTTHLISLIFTPKKARHGKGFIIEFFKDLLGKRFTVQFV